MREKDIFKLIKKLNEIKEDKKRLEQKINCLNKKIMDLKKEDENLTNRYRKMDSNANITFEYNMGDD